MLSGLSNCAELLPLLIGNPTGKPGTVIHVWYIRCTISILMISIDGVIISMYAR